MKCKVCGFRLADGAAKCPICGAMPRSTKAGNIAEDANLPRYLCPSCKAEIIGEHRYCPSCMKELSEAAKTVGIKEQDWNNCIKCGVSLPVGAKFCHKCGAKQEAANVSAGSKETPLEAFEYEIRGGKYILKGVKDTSLTDIVIPSVFSKIEGERIQKGKYKFEFLSAFNDCIKLKSVIIPDTITEIGEFAFYECSGLTNITIPNSVTKIGLSAFVKCSGLTSITIPNSVTKIGDVAFHRCSGLTSITIPNSVTEIGYSAFDNCSGLTSITIPNSVTKIGDYAFAECRKLTNITIPNSVTKIGDYAFYKCYFLKYVSIENNRFRESDIARIFGDSPSFTKIKIGNKVVKFADLY